MVYSTEICHRFEARRMFWFILVSGGRLSAWRREGVACVLRCHKVNMWLSHQRDDVFFWRENLQQLTHCATKALAEKSPHFVWWLMKSVSPIAQAIVVKCCESEIFVVTYGMIHMEHVHCDVFCSSYWNKRSFVDNYLYTSYTFNTVGCAKWGINRKNKT